jgi:cytochrome b561
MPTSIRLNFRRPIASYTHDFSPVQGFSTFMPSTSSPTRYSLPAMALHWLLALALIGLLVFGWYMTGLPFSPARLKFYNWHKWAGVTLLLLSALRLFWRLSHVPPALPDAMAAAMPRWQQVAHHGVHHLLYVLFFAVPLLGWAYSSAAGFPIVWFGQWQLPDLVGKDAALAETLKPLHMVAAYTMAALIVLHIAAAFKHHFVDRDGLLRRMWPGRAV